MITTNFTFLSADGKTAIHAVKWESETVPYCAILQISHGMVEFIERYQNFAEYLVQQGYLVVGHDHLGHGQSVSSQEDWGYVGENPSDLMVEDMHKLRLLIQAENPHVPYFMMAHSMGSYMLRKYLSQHNQDLAGAIIMGTGYISKSTTNLAKFVTRTVALFRGWKYRSSFVADASFGKPYKKFDLTGRDAANSWLTKDPEVVKWYYSTPECSFLFTLNGFLGLFQAVECACRQSTVDLYPKNLPVLLVSGADDPVGESGVGVKKVYEMFQKAALKDVTMKLYETDRHEILNELDKETVYADLAAWMNARR